MLLEENDFLHLAQPILDLIVFLYVIRRAILLSKLKLLKALIEELK